MRTESGRALAFALLCTFAAQAAAEQTSQRPGTGSTSSAGQTNNRQRVSPSSVPMTDWGGGYLRGPDSASVTVATSGAGTAKPTPVVVPVTQVNVPLTDWGGGYLRGPDSASTTVATSGAGAPKPNN